MTDIEKEQKKIYDDQTKAFMKDRKANVAEKKAPLDPLKAVVGAYVAEGSIPSNHTIEAHGTRGMKNTPWRKTFKHVDHLNDWAEKNDSVEVHGTRDLEQAKKGNLSPAIHEEVSHKVGDTVYATHPVKRYTTMTGKVARIGKTLTTLTHKDGTTGTYPHHDVNKDYEVLHPNPYTKERDKRANESVDEAKGISPYGPGGLVRDPPEKEIGVKIGKGGMKQFKVKTPPKKEKDKIEEQAKWRQGYSASGHPPGFKHKSGEIGPLGGTHTNEPSGYDGDTKKVPVQKHRDKEDELSGRANTKVSTTGKPLLPRNAQKNLKGAIKQSAGKHGPVGVLPEGLGDDFADMARGMKNKVEEAETLRATIGTTGYVKHPTDASKRLSGKVTSVGKTHLTLQHKDGSKEMYLHKDVAVNHPALKESMDEGKMVPTHSASGKPNPNHPAFATHKAKYDADKKAAQAPRAKAAPTESPVKLHHIDSAISNSYPDVEPYEHLARKFPDLHKAQGKTGSKLMDHLHDVVKKHKAGKDYHDYVNKAHADIKSDAEFDKRNESMDYLSFSDFLTESLTPGKTVYTSHMDKVLKGKIVEPDEEDKKYTIVKIEGKRHSVHNDDIHFRKEHAGFMLESVYESVFKGTPTVKTDNYSWGTMKTIHHGHSFSIPLHPEHHQAISKLNDGESHVFKDETKAKWTATRKGPTVHFSGSVGHTAVPHKNLQEGVFDWKANKSELDWTDKKDKKTEKSAEGGTIHKARETERNAEFGGKAPKKNVGRPAGKYDGDYKIDRAKRADPKNKEELSKKVMAAKASGFADRAVYKTAITAAIKKRQEELWHADPANKK